MNHALKRALVMAYIIDILLIPLSIYSLIWWKKEHNRPGLAEMMDSKQLVARLVIEIIVFIVCTAVLVINRYYKGKNKRKADKDGTI